MGNSLGNAILFPAPQSSYDATLTDLIWIDERYSDPRFVRVGDDVSISSEKEKEGDVGKDGEEENLSHGGDNKFFKNSLPTQMIPAIFLRSQTPTHLTILYWHGNSCDVGQVREELSVMGKYLDCNVLALEFPGYGLRGDLPTTGETLDKWSKAAFLFLKNSLHILPSSIFLFGRSIGTGPACRLGADLKKCGINVGGVVLHAPYISVHKIVSEYNSLGTWLIPDYWNSEAELASLEPSCPLLIIHGIEDEVIPLSHGKTLFQNYQSPNKMGSFPADSTHNNYYIIDDIGKPLEQFFLNHGNVKEIKSVPVVLPDWCVKTPMLSAWQESGENIPAEEGMLRDLVNQESHFVHNAAEDQVLHDELHT